MKWRRKAAKTASDASVATSTEAPVVPPVTPSLRIDVLTIFPELIENYVSAGVVGRGRRQGIIDIRAHDLRDATTDARRTVDDAPFGGGAGMVFRPEPVFAAVEKFNPPRPIYFLSPTGEPFDQACARRLATEVGSFSLLCGRYEGIDHRVIEHLVDGELSIGDFVLAGGELGALVVIEAVSRLIPGVLGNEASPGDESFSSGLLEYPQFTRPSTFQDWTVPEVLLGGNHAAIERWRHAAAIDRTMKMRPDLMAARGGLSAQEKKLLVDHGYEVEETDI